MASRTTRSISDLSLLVRFMRNGQNERLWIPRSHESSNDTGQERTRDMATRVEAITKRPGARHQAWRALSAHYRKVRELHLRQLFEDDLKRGTSMTAEALGLLLDYSKNRITAETLGLLLKLAEESGLRERIDA